MRNTELEQFRKGQKETPHVWTPPRILLSGIHLGWTRRAPPGRILESEWLAKDNPETNAITIKPETASHVAELFSWVPLPHCSPPGCPFPIKSLALSAHVSPWTIHFRVLDKSPVSSPRRGPHSCNSCKRDRYKVLQTNSINVYLGGWWLWVHMKEKKYAYSESFSMPNSLGLSQKRVSNIWITSYWT